MSNEKRPTRPMGWMNPYWERAGLYVCVTLVSFLVSLLTVRFGCGVLLRAVIPAEPIVWRLVELMLDLSICVGVTWYFASREGYIKRTATVKTSLVGGLLFLLFQCPVTALVQAAAGPVAITLAQLIYFGNDSIFASSIDKPPLLLVWICTAVADVVVLTPAMAVGERIGAKAYRKEQAAITGKNNKCKRYYSSTHRHGAYTKKR